MGHLPRRVLARTSLISVWAPTFRRFAAFLRLREHARVEPDRDDLASAGRAERRPANARIAASCSAVDAGMSEFNQSARCASRVLAGSRRALMMRWIVSPCAGPLTV